MTVYLCRVDFYLRADTPEEAEERLDRIAHKAVELADEAMRWVVQPRPMPEESGGTPKYPVTREKQPDDTYSAIGDRSALVVGDAIVPEDVITGIRVHPEETSPD